MRGLNALFPLFESTLWLYNSTCANLENREKVMPNKGKIMISKGLCHYQQSLIFAHLMTKGRMYKEASGRLCSLGMMASYSR